MSTADSGNSRLIRRMAGENPVWGEERIANEEVGQARDRGLAEKRFGK
jgi:hypothetical protein